MLAILLFAVSLTPLPRWTKGNGAYHIHNYYLGGYGDLIGDYYQARLGDKFTVQCNTTGSKPLEMDTEAQARAFVLACPK